MSLGDPSLEAWTDLRGRHRSMWRAFLAAPLIGAMLALFGHELHLPELFRRAAFLAVLGAVIVPFARFLRFACPRCRRTMLHTSLQMHAVTHPCPGCDVGPFGADGGKRGDP